MTALTQKGQGKRRGVKRTLRDFSKQRERERYQERLHSFHSFITELGEQGQRPYMREILSPMDREVLVRSGDGQPLRPMLMFGSNNYLGLANHPYVKEVLAREVKRCGHGVGGPPLLNGYTALLSELEKRLAAFKGKEACIVFSSGYATNLAIFSSLISKRDRVLVDREHHASCFDGLALGGVSSQCFLHNDSDSLRRLLEAGAMERETDTFIALEGVYSMRGDVAPLKEMVELAEEFSSFLILDDAHGTGVMGEKGAGTANHFGVEDRVELVMGTFSKTFAIPGGFVAGSREAVSYLRYFARPYVFSGSLAPAQAAVVLAGLDLIEQDDTLVTKLWKNIRYAEKKLREIGLEVKCESAILTLPVPQDREVREMAVELHDSGLFVNGVEYPAAPKGKECFRVSFSAAHTFEDIDTLVEGVKKVWRRGQ